MIIRTGKMSGRIRANASKSCLQRALVISALAKGESRLFHCDESDDVKAVKSALVNLGAEISGSETLHVSPLSFELNNDVLVSAGESGLALRMLSPVASLFSRPVTISGTGSLIERPLKPLLDVLDEAGIKYKCNKGQLPLKIIGTVKNKHLQLDGSFSSQILTGLLITLPLLSVDSVINVRNLVSKPYVELTLELIEHFGVQIVSENCEKFFIQGNQQFIGIEYEVEGDWSGASNFLVGAAISGEVYVEGLRRSSRQADKFIIEALKLSGAEVIPDVDGVFVKKNRCESFSFDSTHCPDVIPILAVLAAAANGTSVLEGADRLIHKESNRAKSTVNMIKSLGGDAEFSHDCILVHGKGRLHGGTVLSYNDHRIVMAAAIASCISEHPVQIVGAEAVGKSFPGFFRELSGLF